MSGTLFVFAMFALFALFAQFGVDGDDDGDDDLSAEECWNRRAMCCVLL